MQDQDVTYENHECQSNAWLHNRQPYHTREFVPLIPCFFCFRRNYYARFPAYMLPKQSRYEPADPICDHAFALLPDVPTQSHYKKKYNKRNKRKKHARVMDLGGGYTGIPVVDELKPLNQHAVQYGVVSRSFVNLGTMGSPGSWVSLTPAVTYESLPDLPATKVREQQRHGHGSNLVLHHASIHPKSVVLSPKPNPKRLRISVLAESSEFPKPNDECPKPNDECPKFIDDDIFYSNWRLTEDF